MGKIYIDTIKYMIHADFEIKGLVEKPDVVGAVFGQTEGLLGDELDLREMQKSGRIGRIEVELVLKDGKSKGEVLLPSSLDMVETSVIAAAIESVDRVGPCEATLKVTKIEDMRSVKRRTLIDRAKILLKSLVNDTLPESKEILEMVRDEVKASGVMTYGPDKLIAGPEIDGYDSIIVVEGRADVINMLKNDIKNVIALGGASVPDTIVELSKKKEITLFLDGDRGGDIILKQIMDVSEIDFVARAPPGREVEELARKEIIKALRTKVPIEQAESQYYNTSRNKPQPKQMNVNPNQNTNQNTNTNNYSRSSSSSDYRKRRENDNRNVVRTTDKRRESLQTSIKSEIKEEKVEEKDIKEIKGKDMSEELRTHLEELNGTLKSRLLNKKNELVKELPVRDLITEINKSEGEYDIIVLDGIITQRLMDLASSKKIKSIVGIKEGNITKRAKNVDTFTKQ
jgi:DNA primase